MPAERGDVGFVAMGLGVSYQLRAGAAADGRRLVEQLRKRALAFQREGRVDDVLEISSDAADLANFAAVWQLQPAPGDSETLRGAAVEPEAGYLFPVSVGAECEPLWLGLCRYPRKARAGAPGKGWIFAGVCKTQFASLRGWDHFVRCHAAVIDLLAACRELRLRVRILDEGGYWPRRSLTTLRARIDEMNGLVAAVAGALKDSADAAGAAGTVESPIFRHARFERLEADGVARHGAKIRQAVAAMRRGGGKAPRA